MSMGEVASQSRLRSWARALLRFNIALAVRFSTIQDRTIQYRDSKGLS